jgi:uncharacterized protein YdeI (YjbR/CyaY-like superfamily)
VGSTPTSAAEEGKTHPVQHHYNPRVSAYVLGLDQWRAETETLRAILVDCALTEDLKWGKPCYSADGANIVVLQGFKRYCAVLFFKGVLMSDPHHALVKTGVNTHVGRQLRFADVQQIRDAEQIVRAYVSEAVQLERSGAQVTPLKNSELAVPIEFTQRLNSNAALRTAFDALTPGRQRGYIYYFSAPKQSKTRASRVDNCVQTILDGKGYDGR